MVIRRRRRRRQWRRWRRWRRRVPRYVACRSHHSIVKSSDGVRPIPNIDVHLRDDHWRGAISRGVGRSRSTRSRESVVRSYRCSTRRSERWGMCAWNVRCRLQSGAFWCMSVRYSSFDTYSCFPLVDHPGTRNRGGGREGGREGAYWAYCKYDTFLVNRPRCCLI